MTDLSFVHLAGNSDADLLVVGPSLGTAVEPLWRGAALRLGARFDVVGWDLPGHGRSLPARKAFTIADLADAVVERALSIADGRRIWYAGVSLGGAVGLQIALTAAEVAGVAALASAPKIGEVEGWLERAALVRRAGTPVMVEGSSRRWFTPGFVEREPAIANELLLSLSSADAESYALACEALADFDVCDSLPDAVTPVTLFAGEHDVVITPEYARESAPGAEVQVLVGCAHLPPAEDPATVAVALTHLFTKET